MPWGHVVEIFQITFSFKNSFHQDFKTAVSPRVKDFTQCWIGQETSRMLLTWIILIWQLPAQCYFTSRGIWWQVNRGSSWPTPWQIVISKWCSQNSQISSSWFISLVTLILPQSSSWHYLTCFVCVLTETQECIVHLAALKVLRTVFVYTQSPDFIITPELSSNPLKLEIGETKRWSLIYCYDEVLNAWPYF